MGIWLKPADVVAAVSLPTVIACCDDDNTGNYSVAVVTQLIEDGEQEALSYLVGIYGPAPIDPTVMTELAADPFLKYCALAYVVALLFERHPEYVRSSSGNRSDRFKRADERMKRVLDARQRAPSVAKPPANVGGVVIDGASRLYVDNPDGSRNSGDY